MREKGNQAVCILILLVLVPSEASASEIVSILEGLMQLIIAGIAILLALLIPLLIYFFKRKQQITPLLYVIGGVAILAGLLMSESRSDEIKTFGILLFIAGLLNIAVPLIRKPR